MNKIAATVLIAGSLLGACGRETVTLGECVEAWNSSVPEDFEGFGEGVDVFLEPIDEQDRLGYGSCVVSWYSTGGCRGRYSQTMPEPSEFQFLPCSGTPLPPDEIEVSVSADGFELEG